MTCDLGRSEHELNERNAHPDYSLEWFEADELIESRIARSPPPIREICERDDPDIAQRISDMSSLRTKTLTLRSASPDYPPPS